MKSICKDTRRYKRESNDDLSGKANIYIVIFVIIDSNLTALQKHVNLLFCDLHILSYIKYVCSTNVVLAMLKIAKKIKIPPSLVYRTFFSVLNDKQYFLLKLYMKDVDCI